MREVDSARNMRMIPLSRLRSRLGLDPYNKAAPVNEEPLKFKSLSIALSQHIGAPAVAKVTKGDKVTAGQLIAAPAENALSVAIHSPIDGIVTDVTKNKIIISI